MAISIYDEQFLNDEQKKRLQAFTDAWNEANARGDKAAMEAAHAAAERVRAEANYSGTMNGGGFVDFGSGGGSANQSAAAQTKPADSPTYTPAPAPDPYVPAPLPDPYEPAQLPSYRPQTEAVNRLYDARREAALAALRSAFEANASTLEAQRAEIPGVFQTQRNAAAAQSEQAGRSFNEYAAASGLNSGTGGQAALARSNRLQGDLSALGQQEAAEQRKLENQLAQLKLQYQNDIASAIANGEYERAAALLEEYRRAEESAVTTAQAQADENYRGWQSGVTNAQFAADENYRAWQSGANSAQFAADENYRSWQSGVSSRESELENQYADFQRRLQMAELQAQYGDLSSLRELGVDTSAYEAQMAAAQAARSSGSSGGSRSGGGSGGTQTSIPPLGTNDWMDYIISGAEASGQTVEDFLRSHKSELGITEGNVKTYAERITQYQGEKQTQTETSGGPVPDASAVADSEAHYAARQAAAGSTSQTGLGDGWDIDGNTLKVGSPANTLYGLLTHTPMSYDEMIDRIEAAYKSGEISESAARYLASVIDISGRGYNR